MFLVIRETVDGPESAVTLDCWEIVASLDIPESMEHPEFLDIVGNLDIQEHLEFLDIVPSQEFLVTLALSV